MAPEDIGIQIYEGRVGSLRRFKDDASEVKSGFECGIGIEGYNDLKIGDDIRGFMKQSLSDAPRVSFFLLKVMTFLLLIIGDGCCG